MKKETENWLKIARHDLKIAEALFKEGLYLGVIEHGHAALEKLIKGIIVNRSNKIVPKILGKKYSEVELKDKLSNFVDCVSARLEPKNTTE